MAGNKLLTKAKRNKKDEFYTQLSDIEKELRHYTDQSLFVQSTRKTSKS